MRALTNQEKRTIRFATVAIALYLVCFFGLRIWRRLEATRLEYEQLVAQAQKLRQEFQPYENKMLLLEKLKESLRLDPSKLSRTSLVAEASAAIQRAAQSGGIQLGPIRETHARASSKELTSMQLEGAGPIAAVLAFLHRLETLGYPLIIESVQINPDTRGPAMVKLSLTIAILDFEQWKNEEPRHA